VYIHTVSTSTAVAQYHPGRAAIARSLATRTPGDRLVSRRHLRDATPLASCSSRHDRLTS